MGVELNYAGETVIAFEDDTYRWVSVKRFQLAGRGAASAVLASLIAHPEYLDPPNRSGTAHWHGPYDARAITPGAFEAIGVDRVAELFEGLCQLHDRPPAPAVRDRIDEVAHLLRAAECYHLRELPEAVVMGGAFLDFREVVGIDWVARGVFLFVLAADV